MFISSQDDASASRKVRTVWSAGSLLPLCSRPFILSTPSTIPGDATTFRDFQGLSGTFFAGRETKLPLPRPSVVFTVQKNYDESSVFTKPGARTPADLPAGPADRGGRPRN